MTGVEMGSSEAARATYRLFEAWTGWSEGRLSDSEAEEAFEGAPVFASEVV